MRPVAIAFAEEESVGQFERRSTYRGTSSVAGGVLMCTFGVAVFLGVLLITPVFAPRHRTVPEIVQDSYTDAMTMHRAAEGAVSSKEEFINKMALRQEESFGSKVHYVMGIVRSARKDPEEARKLAVAIVRASMKAEYDPLLVASVIKAESTFNRHAVSYMGAKGLMQILPDTGSYISRRHKLDWEGIRDLHDTEYNLMLGIAYLKELESQFKGNLEHALIAYNWGPGNLIKAFKGEKVIPSSSVKYARGILSRRGKWHREYLAMLNPERAVPVGAQRAFS
jgi:hypothetical protein